MVNGEDQLTETVVTARVHAARESPGEVSCRGLERNVPEPRRFSEEGVHTGCIQGRSFVPVYDIRDSARVTTHTRAES